MGTPAIHLVGLEGGSGSSQFNLQAGKAQCSFDYLDSSCANFIARRSVSRSGHVICFIGFQDGTCVGPRATVVHVYSESVMACAISATAKTSKGETHDVVSASILWGFADL